MKRLAIVSSYSESCGNAAFTKVLVDSINRYSTVHADGIGLPLTLTQSLDGALRLAADKQIAEMAKRLSTYDAVNLQIETGLYGIFPSDVIKRLKMLMVANKNTSFTLHAPRLISTFDEWQRNAYRDALKLKLRSALKNYIGGINANKYVMLNRKVVKMATDASLPVIVHTERSKALISAIVQYDNVHTHPLRFVSPDFVPNPSVIANLRKAHGIAPTTKVIGIFGYISRYKGHLDALKMMANLTGDYVLFVVGRQHPQTIRPDAKDGFLNELEIESQTKELEGKVVFIGELPDDEFLSVAATVDVCLLPYYENGQDGSGIASICLDLNPRVLCSASFAFDELFRLLPYNNCMRFDIGNAIEMAGKLQAILRVPSATRPFTTGPFTVQSQALLYASFAGGEAKPDMQGSRQT